tara:strand:+ start:511 stop:1524 length:1014 start_codon:yes stop_codon:yes gene_type:complete
MTRTLNFLLFTAILLLKFQINHGYSLEFDIRKLKLTHSSIQNFKEIISQNCESKLFSKKFKEHTSYPKFGTITHWKYVCSKLDKSNYDKSFLIENFRAISFSNKKELLTGYYEPTIKISNIKTNVFRYPLLRYSKNMIFERSKINKIYEDRDVLYWTDDLVDLFFLQVQGSGIGEYKNGEKVKISYAGNNGFPYTSIGKVMIEKGYLKKGSVTLRSIKDWLRNNNNKKEEILNKNKRYIFFKTSPFLKMGPVGAMGKKLIPNISIAIDSKLYPFGIPFIMKTDYKKHDMLAFAHDTGSAIKGLNRADLFMGSGKLAEEEAGNLKKPLLLISLVPIIR